MATILLHLLGFALLGSGIASVYYMWKLKAPLMSISAFLRVFLGIVHLTDLAFLLHDLVPLLFILMFANDTIWVIYRSIYFAKTYEKTQKYSRQMMFILNKSNAGIIMIENRKEIVFLNQSMAHILGGCVQDYANLDIHDVVENDILKTICSKVDTMKSLPLTSTIEYKNDSYSATFLKTINGSEIITGIISYV